MRPVLRFGKFEEIWSSANLDSNRFFLETRWSGMRTIYFLCLLFVVGNLGIMISLYLEVIGIRFPQTLKAYWEVIRSLLVPINRCRFLQGKFVSIDPRKGIRQSKEIVFEAFQKSVSLHRIGAKGDTTSRSLLDLDLAGLNLRARFVSNTSSSSLGGTSISGVLGRHFPSVK